MTDKSILDIIQSFGGVDIKVIDSADYGGNDFPALIITGRCKNKILADLMSDRIKQRLGESGEINGTQFRHYHYRRDGDVVIEFGMNQDGWMREESKDEVKRLLKGLGLPDHLTVGGDKAHINGSIDPMIAKDLKDDVNQCLELSAIRKPNPKHEIALS